MTNHTDLREQISDLLDEFAPVSSTRIIADEIVNRLVAPVLERRRAERAALWTMLKRQTRRVQRWRRWTMDANTEITRLRDLGQQLCAAIGVPDAVEPIEWARDLRGEIQQLRIEPAGYMHAVTNEVFEPEDLVVITPDGPAAIADTTCHGASSCKSPVHFDSCMSETPGERIPDRRNAPREWMPGERVRVRGHRDRTGTVDRLDTPGRVRVAWDTHPDTPMSVPADRIEPAEETRVRSWHVGDHEPIEEGLRLMGRDSRYASDEWKPDEYWYRLSSGVWSGPWGYKLGWDALLEHQAPLVEYRKPTEETR